MPQILDVLQNMADWYNAEVAAVVNLIYRRYEQGVEQLDEVLYLSEQIAFLCGLWNGLVDFVVGIFKFLGVLLQAQYDIAQNFQAVLEAIDDFREAWAAFSFADFFETAWRLQQDMLVELLLFFTDPNPRENYNFDRIAYVGGFGVGFIASFFIPGVNVAKVSGIAKYSKFIPEEFISSLNIAKVRELKGSKALIQWLEEVSTLLGKKGEEMYQELKKLLDKVLDWVKKNEKSFKKIEDVNPSLLPYIRIIKRNADYKISLEYIKLVRRPLGRWLPLEQEAAVNLYTKSYYIAFNKALRKQKGYRMTSEFKAMQQVLDDALDKLPVSDYNNGILQRSAYFTEKEVNKLFKVGEDFVEEGYFSTTYSEEALYKWMRTTFADNVLFKVHGKNGKLIEASSNIPDEAEILFRSKTVFTVESVKPGNNPINELEKITIIVLREK